MFRNTLEKQINKLLEYHLLKEIIDQVVVLKEDFKKYVCTQDLEERLNNICKKICETKQSLTGEQSSELDTQCNS